MQAKVAGLALAAVAIASLASAGKAEDDRPRLEAMTSRIAQFTSASSAPATAQVARQMLGSPANRIIRRAADGSREEEWFYMDSSGWVFMTFSADRLRDVREFSTSAVYVDDEPEMGSREAATVTMLSLIDLGWSKKKVEALGIRPKQKMSKEQVEIGVALVRKLFDDMKSTNGSGASEMLNLMSFMSGQMMIRNITGEMWIFETRHYMYSVMFNGDEVAQVTSGAKLSPEANRVLMSRIAR